MPRLEDTGARAMADAARLQHLDSIADLRREAEPSARVSPVLHSGDHRAIPLDLEAEIQKSPKSVGSMFLRTICFSIHFVTIFENIWV